MKKIAHILISLFCILLFNNYLIKSQDYNAVFCKNSTIDSTNSNKLFFGIEGCGFLKNNEYFNPYSEGYTLIGYLFNPSFVYYPTSNLSLRGGAHFLKYSGVTDFTKVDPIFRFQYQATDRLTLVLGSLYGSNNHQLIDQLLQEERFFTHNNESGVQLLVDRTYFKSDTWLNWEEFIFNKSSNQERFTLGSANQCIVPVKKHSDSLYFPFSVIVTHRGGQINITDRPLQSIVNFSAGAVWKRKYSDKLALRLSSSIISFRDISFTKEMPASKGQGYYNAACIEYKKLFFELGNWYAKSFYASRGEQLYSSFSADYPSLNDDRNLMVGKIIYNKQIYNDLWMGARFESFYDLIFSTFDYSYSVHLIINHDFFIKKISYD